MMRFYVYSDGAFWRITHAFLRSWQPGDYFDTENRVWSTPKGVQLPDPESEDNRPWATMPGVALVGIDDVDDVFPEWKEWIDE